MLLKMKKMKIITKRCPYIPQQQNRMLIIAGSGSRKTNVLLNLIKVHWWPYWQDVLYGKDLNEQKHQFQIKKREVAGIKYINDPKTFIEHSQYMNDVYNNINDYNTSRRRKNLIVLLTWLLILWLIKSFKVQLKNYLLDPRNWKNLLYLLHNLIFLFQKNSD